MTPNTDNNTYNVTNGQVYGWGDNVCGQVGNDTLEPVLTPTHIEFEEDIVLISCGLRNSLAVTLTGRVWVWGLNSFGQLGHWTEDMEYVTRPVLLPGLEDIAIAKAVCGPHHTLLLSTDGYVFAFGDNRCGQIGNGKMKSVFKIFRIFDDNRFVDIIAHKENDVSIAVAEDHRFFVWGLIKNRRYLRPQEIRTGLSIFDVYAEVVRKSVTYKTVLIDDYLKTWERIDSQFESMDGFDSNQSILKCLSKPIERQLIRPNLMSNSNRQTIDDFVDIRRFTRYDIQLIDDKILNSIRLLYVYQRGQSVMFALLDDTVYSLGFNRKGALGLGHRKENLREPEMNLTLSGKQIIDIVSGYEHCIGLTAYGECYSWGLNQYGQLGIGNTEDQSIPQKIDEFFDKMIVQICCGAYHSIAVTSEGELFSWGHNTFAQLGDETYNSRVRPTQVLIRGKIVFASCGSNHTMALTAQGVAYVWGSNETGQMGRPKESDFRPSRETAMCKKPQKITGFDGLTITRALCGPYHSMVLTSDGSVFTFGDNRNGQIGNGTTEPQFTPCLLNNRIKIKDILTHWENDLSIAISDDNRIFVWGLVDKNAVLKPKQINESIGKSLYDIYLRFSDCKVTYQAFNTNEDINRFDFNLIKTNNYSNDKQMRHHLNESKVNLNYKSVESLQSSVITSNSVQSCGHNEEHNEMSVDCNQYDVCPPPRRDSLVFDYKETLTPIENVLLERVGQAFNNQNTSDVMIRSGDKVIYCHKTVLEIRNNSFWIILSKNLNENNEVIINSNTFDSFRAFIQFIYGLVPEVNVHSIRDLWHMSKCFEEPHLDEWCSQWILDLSIDVNNVCPVYELAVNSELEQLKHKCFEFVANNDLKDLFGSKAFQDMDETLAKQLIRSALTRND